MSTFGSLKAKDPAKYALAKARVLGLGFGCGPDKFQVLAKVMCDLDLTLKECKQIVKDFRATNKKIVAFWARLQRGALWSRGGDYEVELPSGRTMTYYDIRRGSSGITASLERGGTRRVHTYGGKIAENVTQATARDVFCEGMLCLEDMGLPQLFHVHDEHVLEVDIDVKEEDIEHAIAVTPDWLEGCPVGAEVIKVDRYTK